jgi:ribosome-associated protein
VIQEASTIDPVTYPTAGARETRPTAEDSRDLAIGIADVIADTPAADTLVLDIHELSSFADYFVICSGENERQLRAISDTIAEKLAERGTRPERSEGTPAAGWVVLDYGDVIVHVFDVDQRSFYRLESLWFEAPTLLAIQ